MNRWLGLDGVALWLLRKIQFLWVRTKVLPEGARPEGLDPDRPVCYVMERSGLADLLVLEQVCIDNGLPQPTAGLRVSTLDEPLAVFALRVLTGLMVRRPTGKPSARLERLVASAMEAQDADVQLIPVSVYWGRSPAKERSGFQLLLSEDWAIGGRFRHFLTVLFNGRNTLVQLSQPMSLRHFVSEGAEASRVVRKISRVLRVHFRRLRVGTLGPDLSHRRTIVNQIVQAREVRDAIAAEIKKEGISEQAARRKAEQYALEIAADYSYRTILVLERLLTRLWNRLYDGVDVGHLENLMRVSQGNEIVYVPCHRSHIDYLLLSYVVYQNGIAIPHVAAGINLNLPVIGRILRRGGAFFLRRSFKGNLLYSSVFNAYLRAMLSRGFPIEYFIEGGRSRTGRLLQPKSGMLSMTVHNYLSQSRRPLVFVPVYFGYEKLVEGRTYIGELSGRPKERESVLGFLKVLPMLRSQFGKVFVNFGEPIHLEDALRRYRAEDDEPIESTPRPAWAAEAVTELGQTIMERINEAAVVSPVNLLALTVLATPKQALPEVDLLAQLKLYASLLDQAPYSPWILVAGNQVSPVEYGEKLGLIERHSHELGDVIHMQEDKAVLLTYFRNNILHLFAIPSLIACCFLNNTRLQTKRLIELIKLVYPYVQSELFLRWPDDELDPVIKQAVDVLVGNGLLRYESDGAEVVRPEAGSTHSLQLRVLANAMVQTLERYYMTIALLLKNGSGRLTRRELENQCHLMAQRMSMLFELNSPEFFDRVLFKNFIDLLCRREVLVVDSEGKLIIQHSFEEVEDAAALVLSEHLRHSILQVTQGEAARGHVE